MTNNSDGQWRKAEQRKVTQKGDTGTAHKGEAVTGYNAKIFVPTFGTGQTAGSEVVVGLSDDGHQGVRLAAKADVTRRAMAPMGLGQIGEDETVTANTRVGLGINERGFVGLITTIDHGNVFLCAATMGGADLGSNYHHTERVGTIVETSLGLVRAGLLWWGKKYTGNWSTLQSVLATGQLIWAAIGGVSSPLSGGMGGATNFDYLKTGHVKLFGARSVKLQSIEGVSSSAALFNSMSSGLSASVNSVLTASVNSGLLASVNGAYSASLNANDAAVIGGVGAALSSRVGAAKVEGATIRIGNKRQAGMKAKHLSGLQESTKDLWLRAAEFIEIGVPSEKEPPETPADYPKDGHLVNLTKPPVGVQIVHGNVRMSAGSASSNVSTSEVTSLAGQSLIKAGPNGIVVGRLKASPMTVSSTALEQAREAYHVAWHTSEGVVNQLKSVGGKITGKGAMAALGAVATFAVAAGAVTGAATAAAAGLGALAGKGEGEAGADEGARIGAITGSVIGGVGALTAMFMSAMKTAGIAQRAGQQAAQKAYTKAIEAALAGESLQTTLDPMAPKVEVTDSHVKLSFGPPVGGSSIKVSSAGVEIKGSKVTVNDMEFMPPMVPAVPTPPVIPVPNAPAIPIPQMPLELDIVDDL